MNTSLQVWRWRLPIRDLMRIKPDQFVFGAVLFILGVMAGVVITTIVVLAIAR